MTEVIQRCTVEQYFPESVELEEDPDAKKKGKEKKKDKKEGGEEGEEEAGPPPDMFGELKTYVYIRFMVDPPVVQKFV